MFEHLNHTVGGKGTVIAKKYKPLYLKYSWDFPGGPVVKTLPSNAGGAASIPGGGAKVPRAPPPRGQKTKTEAIL